MSRRSKTQRPRRFPTKLLGFGLTALVALLYFWGNPLLDVLELKTYDIRLLRLPANPPKADISIAAVDEKSIAQLGRWPWSRETVARLVERLDQLGAHVIAFDVFFSEAEGAADERLRQAIAKNGRTVLSMVFLFDEDEVKHVSAAQNARAFAAAEKHEIAIVRHRGDDKPPAFAEPGGLIVNLPRIQSVGKYAGHINISPDGDGALRWASLAIPYKGRFFPSADTQAVRAFGGGGLLSIYTNHSGVEGLEVNGRFIATDERGRALIRYYGPEQTFTTFSVADILERNFDASLVKNRIVLIGASAKGIGDIRVTPYSPAFPGVEVRATVMQNLLRGDFIQRPDWISGLDVVLLVLLGVVLSLVLPRLRVAQAAGLISLLLILYIGVGFYLFDVQRIWFNITYPAFLLVLLFVSTTLVQYFLTEKEKRHIKSAFQHYVPAKVVEEITENIEKLKLGGEKRELSVLFSDIRGFTTISESLPPEDLVRLLNIYLTRMTEQVFKHDGLLDKYIGDAIMAVYGAPIHRPDHALLACQTALDMMRELRGLQVEWKQDQRPAIDIGVGINTGTMIVGNMGSVNRFDYTVIGDAVNLGSRIEHLNKEYGTHILMSEFTYAEVRDKFKAVREVDVTRVRGRGGSVRIYELIPDGEYKTLDWLDEFDKARRYFHDGQLAKAKPLFERLVKAVGDPVSKRYLERIQAPKQKE
ncbi:MAG TPA: adenylate/guanylate cyclase domain-containing protein [Burkholderiales bacterium]|nr:adenylate/guanylate cyclase domain-containing protein [Burkholderiales bacterium]